MCSAQCSVLNVFFSEGRERHRKGGIRERRCTGQAVGRGFNTHVYKPQAPGAKNMQSLFTAITQHNLVHCPENPFLIQPHV